MLNKRPLILVIVILFVYIFSACKFKLPTQSDYPDPGLDIKTIWSPYAGVHPFGIYENIQQPQLLKLIQSGALRGVRLGNLDNPAVQSFAKWFVSNNIEVLGLFDNEHLRNPDVCQIFSQHVIANPQVITWEIGNEVSGFIGMEPEEYIKVATKLFYYVKQRHPHIKLAIGAVAGNGSSADDLRRMIDAGLDKLCQDGLEIVPIHFYSWRSTRLQEFKSQIARLPIWTKIWVTETNDMPPDWSKQIGYIEEIYPKLRSSLRAERIYWYVFSEGCKKGYSLAKICESGVEYSPLMKALIGSNTSISTTFEASKMNLSSSQNIITPVKKQGENKRKRKRR